MVVQTILSDDLKLIRKGRESVAKIEGVKSWHKAKDGKITYYHVISFDGQYGVLGFNDRIMDGSLIQVTYLPDDPETIKAGSYANKPTSDALLSKSALMGYFCCAAITVVTLANLATYRNRRI